MPIMSVPYYWLECDSCGRLADYDDFSQATFICRSCGVVASADHNAARNIAQRGVTGWAVVMQPDAAPSLQPAGT